MADREPVLVVLGEPGVDPQASLGVDGVFSRRFYVPPAGDSPEAVSSCAPLPPGVARLEAATSADALRAVREAVPEAPILLAHGGERLAGLAALRAPVAGARRPSRGLARVVLPLSIRVARKATHRTPWLGDRRPLWVPAPGDARGAPAIHAAREPGDLSAILALLVRDALATAAPRGPIGAFRLLADPLVTSLRVAIGGGLRDGLRGLLLSALHGLHRLIVLTRAWQSSSPMVRGERP